MPEGEAFAIATQQSHALGKSPKGYGTSEGRRTAKAKFNTPKDDVKAANPKTASVVFLSDYLGGFSDELQKCAGILRGMADFAKSKVHDAAGKVVEKATAAAAPHVEHMRQAAGSAAADVLDQPGFRAKVRGFVGDELKDPANQAAAWDAVKGKAKEVGKKYIAPAAVAGTGVMAGTYGVGRMHGRTAEKAHQLDLMRADTMKKLANMPSPPPNPSALPDVKSTAPTLPKNTLTSSPRYSKVHSAPVESPSKLQQPMAGPPSVRL